MILQIAWRYFVAKKSTQAIQIISWVSMLAMAVGSAALIVVLSVFNGFEGFIKDMYSDFYPEIKMTASHGNFFSLTDIDKKKLQQNSNLQTISYTLEEKVLLENDGNQAIGILKGVDVSYDSVTQFSKHILYGKNNLQNKEDIPTAILGLGLSNKLGINEQSGMPMMVYSFKQNASFNALTPDEVYNSSLFTVSGLYQLQDFIDNQYCFTNLANAQVLTDHENQFSSIEIKLKNNQNASKIKADLIQLLQNKNVKFETRYEQNKTLYFVLKTERWAVFAILSLMLFIASFNIVSSLSMLVVDKEKDIAIMKTMGMNNSDVKKIFLTTGILLSVIGALLGCFIAFIICLLQQHFGFVKLGNTGNFLIDAYPVKMQVQDFIVVLFVVICIAVLASFIPSIKASKKEIKINNN